MRATQVVDTGHGHVVPGIDILDVTDDPPLGGRLHQQSDSTMASGRPWPRGP